MNSVHSSLRIRMICAYMALVAFLALPAITNSQVIGNGYNNSLIYKIQSDTNTVYLLGSIHVLAEEYYPLTRAFSYSYFNSQKVVFEIDPEILFSTTYSEKFQKYMTFQNEKTLKSTLSSKTYALLKKRLAASHIEMAKVKKMKPWAIYLTLSTSVDSSIEFRSDLGIESYFYTRAKDAGKATGGLETMKNQLDVFDKLSFKEQELLLLEVLTIKNDKKHQKEFLKLVKDWHQGNLEGLEQMVQSLKKHKNFYKAILVDRNKNWVPQIEKFLTEDKNVLVIVGAAHLAGEDGLLVLLKNKGYELERVSYAMP